MANPVHPIELKRAVWHLLVFVFAVASSPAAASWLDKRGKLLFRSLPLFFSPICCPLNNQLSPKAFTTERKIITNLLQRRLSRLVLTRRFLSRARIPQLGRINQIKFYPPPQFPQKRYRGSPGGKDETLYSCTGRIKYHGTASSFGGQSSSFWKIFFLEKELIGFPIS